LEPPNKCEIAFAVLAGIADCAVGYFVKPWQGNLTPEMEIVLFLMGWDAATYDVVCGL